MLSDEVRIKVKLNTISQPLLAILYTKLEGFARHETLDPELQITSYLVGFKEIPHFFQVFVDYVTVKNEKFPVEKHPEIVSVEMGGQTAFNDLNLLFKTPESLVDQVNQLQDQVRILGERLDASKAFFFDYQQFHRIPEVLNSLCRAINRMDILEDFASDLVQTEIIKSFHKKH